MNNGRYLCNLLHMMNIDRFGHTLVVRDRWTDEEWSHDIEGIKD